MFEGQNRRGDPDKVENMPDTDDGKNGKGPIALLFAEERDVRKEEERRVYVRRRRVDIYWGSAVPVPVCWRKYPRARRV
jgi:hypothetical protein